jgi:hypothetical protein
MKGKTLREVSPPATMAHPKAIDPELVIHYHRSAEGQSGGTGTVPSFIRTSILNFISMDKEFSRAGIFVEYFLKFRKTG